ncbi:HNH endonuclease [Paenibacillus chitinolyticus]|uniref:HNH endonuclease n=1 Tax=Paenibacillus chitinolyticus TaxID=79263 RepID=UPI003556A785
MVKKRAQGTCELCGRHEVNRTEHHLIPKEKGGTFLSTALLCIPCHKQIHALFTNEQLERGLHTLDALRGDERMRAFLKWIRKQPSAALPRIRKSRELRQ